MENGDEALRHLRERFEHEREERELAARSETLTTTATRSRLRLLPLGRRIRGWLIALVVLAAIAIPLAIVGANVAQRLSIANSVTTFCNDIADQSYSAAYGMLSHQAQQGLSESLFADELRSANLTSCNLPQSGGQLAVSGNLATVTVDYAYADGTNTTSISSGTMLLVNENGGWRVASTDWIHPGP